MPKMQAPREKRLSRAVPPKGYTKAVLVDTAGVRDPYAELLVRDENAKEKARGQEHAETADAAVTALAAAEENQHMVNLRTTKKSYSEINFEASLMPRAIDYLMEERKLIALSPQSVVPEMLTPERDFEDWALTRPNVQVEASYGRFTVVQRGKKEIEDEEQHRKQAQGYWRRYRKRPVTPAESFRVVRLEANSRPFRQSSCRLLYKQRRFAELDLELLNPLLAAAYKTRPETLNGIVTERLTPLCRDHLPKLWKLVAMRLACVLALGAVPALLYLILGWTIVDVASGRLIDLGICAGLLVWFTVPIRRFRRKKAAYIRKCWQQFRTRLDSELACVNAELEALESPDAPGRIRFAPVLVWLGHDPYTSDRMSQVVKAIAEADRFHRARAILADLEERVAKLERQRYELETNGETANTEVIETFGSEKRLRKQVSKQRKALAKLSRRRLLQGREAKVPSGSYLVLHRLTIEVELPGPTNPVLGLQPEPAAMHGERAEDSGGESESGLLRRVDTDLVGACSRCRQITLYTRNVGLESIAKNLCKSAREDAVAFDEYRLRKLLKLEPGTDLAKALGGTHSDGTDDQEKKEDQDENKNKDKDQDQDQNHKRNETETLEDEVAASASRCAVCQGPRGA
ncbi:Hypothetical Protein FCC1311_045562 [Hondaea fermentalgiana]|uniref:Uncharacterized protein n=1 Tax=Hondaea fermentalgiana TaxID=2315210 RepID=A0A2R5GI49_9STRA|nr:Hypothetical Protein FCC1311_045562 [Hondaea fermentalgiana]|eukprot:GBG28333.1 Hypothetical Protein FCC1311_045562 [Hondaea fermentalgiana]